VIHLLIWFTGAGEVWIALTFLKAQWPICKTTFRVLLTSGSGHGDRQAGGNSRFGWTQYGLFRLSTFWDVPNKKIGDVLRCDRENFLLSR
jgi:hypothetical protein